MPRKIDKRKKLQVEKRRAAKNEKSRQRIGVLTHGPRSTTALLLALTLGESAHNKETDYDFT